MATPIAASSRRTSRTPSAPFLRYDGKIGYSRWEHLGDVNDVKIMTMNLDGTQMIAVAGQHGKPANCLVNVTRVRAERSSSHRHHA